MKFTALVEISTMRMVSAAEHRRRQHRHPEDRQLQQLHPLEGHHPGGQHLPGQLGQPVQLADVVDRPDEADDAWRR